MSGKKSKTFKKTFRGQEISVKIGGRGVWKNNTECYGGGGGLTL